MDCDVIVIGGGPAGSTAATLLAEAGHAVTVVEKERFPRFHIGESLLPGDVPVLARLGLHEAMMRRFVVKHGAEFIDETAKRHSEFAFAEALPGAPTYAYQVDRAEFDALLLDRSRAVGARVLEGEKVVSYALSEDAVEVGTAERTLRARYLVDATGQDALLGRRAGAIMPYEGFGRSAVFCHFAGLGEAAQAALYRTGNIQIHGFADGWGWVIPLAGGRLSVGVVSNKKGLDGARLDAFIAESPMLRSLVGGATRTGAQIIRNFSFKNGVPHGARFVCVGDAACFLDPLFSSGVSLAMLSSMRMADALAPALSADSEGDPELMAGLEAHMQRAYASFANMIYRFYHTHLRDNLFFGDASAGQDLRRGVISVLGCDIWRDDNSFQKMLLSANRHDPRTHARGDGAR